MPAPYKKCLAQVAFLENLADSLVLSSDEPIIAEPPLTAPYDNSARDWSERFDHGKSNKVQPMSQQHDLNRSKLNNPSMRPVPASKSRGLPRRAAQPHGGSPTRSITGKDKNRKHPAPTARYAPVGRPTAPGEVRGAPRTVASPPQTRQELQRLAQPDEAVSSKQEHYGSYAPVPMWIPTPVSAPHVTAPPVAHRPAQTFATGLLPAVSLDELDDLLASPLPVKKAEEIAKTPDALSYQQYLHTEQQPATHQIVAADTGPRETEKANSERSAADKATKELRGVLDKAMTALNESEAQRAVAERQRDEAELQLELTHRQQTRSPSLDAASGSNQKQVQVSLREAALVADKARGLLDRALNGALEDARQGQCWMLLRPTHKHLPVVEGMLFQGLVDTTAPDQLTQSLQDGELVVGMNGLMEAMSDVMAASGVHSTVTVNEVSTYLSGSVFDGFAKWLLARRQHQFKSHDTRRVGRLTLDQMRSAMLHYLCSTGPLFAAVKDSSLAGPSEQDLVDELQQLDAQVAALYESSGMPPEGPAPPQPAAPSQVDYERLQYAHSELLAEASRASEAADALRGRFDTLSDELSQLGRKQKQDKREIGLLREASRVLMDRNHDYQKQLDEMDPALEQMGGMMVEVANLPMQHEKMALEKQAAAEAHMEAMAQLAHANETIHSLKAGGRKLKAELEQAEMLAAKAAAKSRSPRRKLLSEEATNNLQEENRRLTTEVDALSAELEDERHERSNEALRLRGQLQEAYTALEEERCNVQTTLARLKVLKEELRKSKKH